MGTLHFSTALLRAEIEAVKRATAHRTLYEEETGPGLWLVGDQGVYLMGNHERPPLPKGQSYAVVYAVECDPETCAFDDWWAVKNATFGGDDGVEFLDLKGVENWIAHAEALGVKAVEMHLSAGEVALALAPRPKAAVN